MSGALHPADLKPAVAKYINMMLEPVRNHFKTNEYARNLFQQVIQFRNEDKERKEKEAAAKKLEDKPVEAPKTEEKKA